MPIIQIDNLGTPGIVTDTLPHELPVNAWSSGDNVRFRNNAVESTPGYDSVYGTLSIAPYWLMPWDDGSNYHWFYANAADIYSVTGTTHTSRSKSVGAYSAGAYPQWNGGVLGGVPVMNNTAFVDAPQSWDGSTKFQDLPNWPFNATPTPSSPKWHARVIRTFKNFLIALDMNENDGTTVTHFPTRVRWSNPADPGTVPGAWIPAATNLAGSVPLSATTDVLMDCLPLRDVNVVYKADTVHLMQFVGGTAVFAFRQAFGEFGLLSRRGVKSFFGKHLVLSKGDVIVHNGQSAQSVIDRKLRSNLFNSLAEDNAANSFVVANPDRKEMWVCIPESGSGTATCTKAYIWHWDDNTWTVVDLPSVAHIGLGFIDRSGASNLIDDQNVIIDTVHTLIDGRVNNPAVLKLLMAQPGGPALFNADSTNQFNGSNFTAYVERTGLAIRASANGGTTTDTSSRKFVRRVYLKMDADPGVTVQVRVGAQQYIDGPVTWTVAQDFDPSTQRYVDVRVQGVAVAIRVESTVNGQWQLSSYGLDLDVVGRA